jgi:hypothetical protein
MIIISKNIFIKIYHDLLHIDRYEGILYVFGLGTSDIVVFNFIYLP